MDSILSTARVSLYRGHRRVYQDLTISFETGVTALLGPNGAGKTTLIESVLQPQLIPSGELRFRGSLVPGDINLATYLADVGHMPQEWEYFRGFSVLESVQYTGWLKRMPSRGLERAAVAALERVGLGDSIRDKVRSLSGGMRQRVGLAEAFVNEPALVLLDEPTVGLDPAQRSKFREYVRDYGREHAVVLSTHLIDDVIAVADRVAIVDDGELLFMGSTEDLRIAGVGSNKASELSASALESGYLAVVAGDLKVDR